jgi:hypothetical protein
MARMVTTFGFATEFPNRIRVQAPAALLDHAGHQVIFSDELRQNPEGKLAFQIPIPDSVDPAQFPGVPMVIPEVVVLYDDYVEHVGRGAIREARDAGQRIVADIERRPVDPGTRANRVGAAFAADVIVVASPVLEQWMGGPSDRMFVVPNWDETVDTDWSVVLEHLHPR